MLSFLDSSLCLDSVPLEQIARAAGTPAYVYSAHAIAANFRAYDQAFGQIPHRVCYAVKANSSLAVLALLAREGAGFDIVSAGELFRVLKAGGDPAKVVFSGVGKTAPEVEYALGHGIHSFNCESEGELEMIDRLARERGLRAGFALRVNPDVDAVTHPYISTGLRDHKFGIGIEEAPAVYERSRRFANLEATGISCHIGSQLLDPSPLMEAAAKVVDLADRLRCAGFPLDHLDLGGGLGIAYQSQDASPEIPEYVRRLLASAGNAGFKIFIEPGRSIVGNAGVLLTRVLFRKKSPSKEFVVVDAGMNDLIRPALYQSHHEIVPVRPCPGDPIVADIVGPVCESGDFLAKGREIAPVAPGDVLAVLSAGAYGFVLSSNYNTRTRAAEVLVQEGAWRIVRERECYEDLVRGETV